MMKITRQLIITTIQAEFVEEPNHSQNSPPTENNIAYAMDELSLSDEELANINTQTPLDLGGKPPELDRQVSYPDNQDGITQQEKDDINAFADKLTWLKDRTPSPKNATEKKDHHIIVNYVKGMMTLNQKLSEKHCCSRLLAWLGCHSITTKKQALKTEVATFMRALTNHTKHNPLR